MVFKELGIQSDREMYKERLNAFAGRCGCIFSLCLPSAVTQYGDWKKIKREIASCSFPNYKETLDPVILILYLLCWEVSGYH